MDSLEFQRGRILSFPKSNGWIAFQSCPSERNSILWFGFWEEESGAGIDDDDDDTEAVVEEEAEDEGFVDFKDEMEEDVTYVADEKHKISTNSTIFSLYWRGKYLKK